MYEECKCYIWKKVFIYILLIELYEECICFKKFVLYKNIRF